MLKRFSLLILFSILINGITNAQLVTQFTKNEAFGFGEELTYRLRYSLYFNINVGEATLSVSEKPTMMGNKEHYHFVANGKTYKFYDAFMKVRDRYESFVETKSFLPSASIRVINEGGFHFDDYCVYDHQKKFAKNKKGKINRIRTFTQDILSGIYLSRTFEYENAKFGDSFLVNIYIDDSNFLLGVRYLGKEIVKIADGTSFRCIKLSPILIVDRVFKNQNDMTLWVSDDKNRIPIKVYTNIAIGSISVELFKYKGLRNNLLSKI
jgi:hypothetical protein